MSNLKDLKNRVKSVESTKKITSAMKMISAAKLKKAQEAAESSRPYSLEMGRIMSDLISKQASPDTAPKLLVGTGGREQKHLIVLITSNRGLCGGFNTSVARKVQRLTRSLEADGKVVQILIVGKKGIDLLRRKNSHQVIGEHLSVTNPRFFNAETIANDILDRFEKGEFDVCTLVYNKFISALSQEPTMKQIIPFLGDADDDKDKDKENVLPLSSIYEYEPSQGEVLNRLLPRNIKVQVFSSLLESTASEHGARMAAMDSATRNAEDLIKDLNLTYNRTRQAVITSELIEIISGAEAL